jgi:hypothetical protein
MFLKTTAIFLLVCLFIREFSCQVTTATADAIPTTTPEIGEEIDTGLAKAHGTFVYSQIL